MSWPDCSPRCPASASVLECRLRRRLSVRPCRSLHGRNNAIDAPLLQSSHNHEIRVDIPVVGRMSRDKNVPNWDPCQFCIGERFVKPLNLHGAAIGPLGAFLARVNVATFAAVGPVPNSVKSDAADASALLALP